MQQHYVPAGLPPAAPGRSQGLNGFERERSKILDFSRCEPLDQTDIDASVAGYWQSQRSGWGQNQPEPVKNPEPKKADEPKPISKDSQPKQPTDVPKKTKFDDMETFDKVLLTIMMITVGTISMLLAIYFWLAIVELAWLPVIKLLKTFGEMSTVSVLALTAFATFALRKVTELVEKAMSK